eukprot:c47784_g1_i1.p1 GENE.c47784_g1_i1~~c47784_g1_i1.p1  ORF type:complete len:267 (+),score=50.00 c47784_g1_i1:62-862(+)
MASSGATPGPTAFALTSGDVKIAALAFGTLAPGCTVAVLIHGLLSNKECWMNEKVASLVCGKGIVCVAIDLQGNGGSSGDWRLGDYARDASDIALTVRLLTEMGAVVRWLFGHSRGANNVLAYAAAHSAGTDPLFVPNVVAFAPRFHMEGLVQRYLSAEQVATALEVGSVFFTPPWGGDPRTATRDDVLAVRAMDNAVMAAAIAASAVRLLLVHGEADDVIPVADAAALAALVPAARFVQVPKVGHMFREKQAKAAFTALSEFFAC